MGLATNDLPVQPVAGRGAGWKWWVCGLLLLATMVNYMDRVTLNSTSIYFLKELHLSNEDYGDLEAGFGVAFALGSLASGWLVDRWNVRGLYPIVVLGWSAAGLATGFARGFGDFMLCRCALGLFEGGNWTCALRTTQRILQPTERATGNGILQSGATVGAVLTPLVVLGLVHGEGTWRYPFCAIGAVGCSWVFLWLFSVSSADLALDQPNEMDGGKKEHKPSGPRDGIAGESVWRVYFQPRFLVLLVIVITINQTWHFFRAWMPLYLTADRGYSDLTMQRFTSCYYVSAGIGSLASGFAALYFIRRGMQVHLARVLVFAGGALLTTLSVVAAFMPTGPLLLALLLAMAFGILALFPQYYSFSQELTTRHQGKLTGLLGFSTWMVAALMQHTVGHWIEQTHDYRRAIIVAGLLPLVGVAALLFWRTRTV